MVRRSCDSPVTHYNWWIVKRKMLQYAHQTRSWVVRKSNVGYDEFLRHPDTREEPGNNGGCERKWRKGTVALIADLTSGLWETKGLSEHVWGIWLLTALWPNLLQQQSWPLWIFAAVWVRETPQEPFFVELKSTRFDPAKDSTKSFEQSLFFEEDNEEVVTEKRRIGLVSWLFCFEKQKKERKRRRGGR